MTTGELWFDVSDECPYYADGYTETYMQWDNNVTIFYGPGMEPYEMKHEHHKDEPDMDDKDWEGKDTAAGDKDWNGKDTTGGDWHDDKDWSGKDTTGGD